MVSLNALSKLCLVVAFGLPTTATATDVAQEQPKKESLDSALSRKSEESATKLHKLPERKKTYTDPKDPPKYSVEWYLLPKPLNRAALRYSLPSYLTSKVPEDCNEPIAFSVETRIREHFSMTAQSQNSCRLYPYCFHL